MGGPPIDDPNRYPPLRSFSSFLSNRDNTEALCGRGVGLLGGGGKEEGLEHDPLNLNSGASDAPGPAERGSAHQAAQLALLLLVAALASPDPL